MTYLPMSLNDQLDYSDDMGREKERKEKLQRGEFKTRKGSTMAGNTAVNDISGNFKGGSEKLAREVNDFDYSERQNYFYNTRGC